eukprot:gene10889-2964_t
MQRSTHSNHYLNHNEHSNSSASFDGNTSNKKGIKGIANRDFQLNPSIDNVLSMPGIMSRQVEESQLLIPSSRYSYEKTLGSGAFASVYHSYDLILRREVAIKAISHNCARSKEDIEREVHIAQTLKHPHIIVGFDSFFTPTTTYLVMELASVDDLYERLKPHATLPLKETCVRKWMRQISSALAYMHKSHQIAHADIKPENILLDTNQDVKLCDFGLARRFGTRAQAPLPGTSCYMSPEQLSVHRRFRKQQKTLGSSASSTTLHQSSPWPYHSTKKYSEHSHSYHNHPSAQPIQAKSPAAVYTYTGSVDIWGLGLVLYATLFADLPWDRATMSDRDFRVYVKRGGFPKDEHPYSLLTPSALGALQAMLHPDASRRWTIDQAFSFFSHDRKTLPWFHSDRGKSKSKEGGKETQLDSKCQHPFITQTDQQSAVTISCSSLRGTDPKLTDTTLSSYLPDQFESSCKLESKSLLSCNETILNQELEPQPAESATEPPPTVAVFEKSTTPQLNSHKNLSIGSTSEVNLTTRQKNSSCDQPLAEAALTVTEKELSSASNTPSFSKISSLSCSQELTYRRAQSSTTLTSASTETNLTRLDVSTRRTSSPNTALLSANGKHPVRSVHPFSYNMSNRGSASSCLRQSPLSRSHVSTLRVSSPSRHLSKSAPGVKLASSQQQQHGYRRRRQLPESDKKLCVEQDERSDNGYDSRDDGITASTVSCSSEKLSKLGNLNQPHASEAHNMPDVYHQLPGRDSTPAGKSESRPVIAVTQKQLQQCIKARHYNHLSRPQLSRNSSQIRRMYASTHSLYSVDSAMWSDVDETTAF